MSLKVLEALLPDFYKNASTVVKMESFEKMRNGTLTTFKKPGIVAERKTLLKIDDFSSFFLPFLNKITSLLLAKT